MLTITDRNGAKYLFEVYHIGHQTHIDVAGVYVFTKKGNNDKHTILYVGETGSFGDRLGPGHEKWESAIREGMTHVCVHETSNRVFVQNQIKDKYNPRLNEV